MITKITNCSNTFQFKFQISLHIDDLKVLEHIQRTFNVGKIQMDPLNSAVFYVTAKDELLVIVGIFTNLLNTTKYFTRIFLSFAEAFTLYTKDSSRKARLGGLIHSLRKL